MMINITVYQSGDISGDSGKIVAYSDEKFTQPIKIVHPIYSNAMYYIEYKYNDTIYKNRLDDNGITRLRVENAGYLKCQFVACDILNGNVIFKSKSWNFIINEKFSTEPSHYPCSIIDGTYYSGHNCYQSISHGNTCSCNHSSNNCNGENFDSYEAYYKLKSLLDNESDIRYNEIEQLKSDIVAIKQALNISNSNSISSVINADLIITSGEYAANIQSINFPEDGQEYTLVVTRHGNNIMQEAFEVDSDNIWFRTGFIENGVATWNSWAPLITRISEI